MDIVPLKMTSLSATSHPFPWVHSPQPLKCWLKNVITGDICMNYEFNQVGAMAKTNGLRRKKVNV